MHFSTLIAGLVVAAATSTYATPLNVRQASKVTPTAAAATPLTPASNNTPTANAASPNPTPQPGFIAELLTADNTVARFKDIQAGINNGQASLKFDFNPAANPAVVAGQGGQVDLASRVNFPVLTNLGISAATLFFEPCGLNTPHTHPRATEFLTLATNNHLQTGFVLENGLTTEFNTTLTQFQGTVFPQGSIHWQQNLDCTSAVAIAGLNSEDPGASSIAQNFIVNTNPDVVQATLGFPTQISGANFAQFKANIPAPFVKGIQECLVRCNIPH